MSPQLKLLVGFALLMLLGWIAIYPPVPLAVPGGVDAKTLQKRVAHSAQSALANNGYGNVVVQAKGQKVFLKGILPAGSSREDVRKLALQAIGDGGFVMGGVTSVDDTALTVLEKADDPYWQASYSPQSGLVMKGYVANNSDENALLGLAGRLYPAGVANDLVLASNAPHEALPGLQALISGLSVLDSGEAGVRDRHYWLKGTSQDRQAALKVMADVKRDWPEGYSGDVEISMPPPPVNQFGVAVDDGMKIGTVGKCQALFTSALAKNPIRFVFGKIKIEEGSFPFLDFLAKLAGQCDGFKLMIAGYTDNIGPESFNIALSEARARSVVTYLVAKGVDASRLHSRGYGPSDPVCFDDTKQCRSRNRRIEIKVQE